jgi:hypothetical protein
MQKLADFVEGSGALKIMGIASAAKQRLASEKGVCSM